MFTGIIRGLCCVISVEDKAGLRRLEIALGFGPLAEGLELGASIAVNGTCLTVVHFETRDENNVIVAFDCIQETLDRANLGSLKVDDKVNIERAMRYGDEIGGHHVSGHVDCVGLVNQTIETPNNKKLYVTFPEEWYKYVVPKGWITIDGVSLTVVDVLPTSLSVSLIPETLSRTTLGFKGVGDKVNLEFDGQAKISVLTMERLLPDLLERVLKSKV